MRAYLPADSSKELIHLQEEMLRFMQKVCDERKATIEYMNTQGQQFLDWDTQQETLMQKEEDEKLKRVREMEASHEQQRLARELEEKR